VALRLEYKATGATAPTSAEPGLVELDESTGVVEAIVSVTGVVDEDNDLVEPGAYAKTLRDRTPKGIFHHDWHKWVAKTLDIAELMPGDPRLPRTTRSGAPWPPQAGALWVKCQFNLATQTGREAFENIKFFANEAEWSIGYKILPGNARKTPQGVRRIKQVELYEYSPVLFGAAPLSGTLSVKYAGGGNDLVEDDSAIGSGLTPTDDDRDEADEDDAAPTAPESPALSIFDLIGGENDGSGESTPPPALSIFDLVEDDEGMESKAGMPGVVDTPSDEQSVRRLKRWYTHGQGAVQIRWGTPGDFNRCVRIASKHMPPGQAKGFCANLHKEALGVWPGREHDKKDTYDPALETGPDAGYLAPEGMEAKVLHVPGTLEDLHAKLRAAVEDLFIPKSGGDYDSPRATEHWVCVEGTWTDRIVVTHERGRDRDSYSIPYSLTPSGDVILGAPQPVTITVMPVITPAAVAAKADSLARLTDALRSDLTASYGMETKVGKVLSSATEKRIRQAVEALIDVLRSAGVDIQASDPVEQPEDSPSVPSVMVDTDTTAPSVRSEKVLLDPALLKRAQEITRHARALQLSATSRP
jgi:phage head maturation protease